MKASTGFDRMSTREELHQVLAVLNDLAQGIWTVPGEDEVDAQAIALSADDDSAEMESLAQFFMNRPELKN